MAMFSDVDILIREATAEVEQSLSLEDSGWIKLGGVGEDVIPDTERRTFVQRARRYYTYDPLARQAIRLWTDYSFGAGMTWQSEDEAVTEILDAFWGDKMNQAVLSAQGQRKSSDRLLVDGETFFAIFLASGGKATIRRIDPLEITEIITDPDDLENIRFYKREWTDRQGRMKSGIYRSILNPKGESALNSAGATISPTEDALVYHVVYNTIGQRGNSILIPALSWIYEYRRFLASRVAIVLALARFAWKTKLTGGQAAVDAIRAVTNEQYPQAGSHWVENQAATLEPIRADSGARNAYDDGRMLKLQVCAAVGLPEQYFGDISIGNLATAKTVELPVLKMFQSYQQVWRDVYQDIDEIVLAHNNISSTKWYVDRDFSAIAPEDAVELAKSIQAIVLAFPDFAFSRDVQQTALLSIGVNNPGEVIDAMQKESTTDVDALLAKALRRIKEAIKRNGHRDL